MRPIMPSNIYKGAVLVLWVASVRNQNSCYFPKLSKWTLNTDKLFHQRKSIKSPWIFSPVFPTWKCAGRLSWRNDKLFPHSKCSRREKNWISHYFTFESALKWKFYERILHFFCFNCRVLLHFHSKLQKKNQEFEGETRAEYITIPTLGDYFILIELEDGSESQTTPWLDILSKSNYVYGP